MFIYSVYEPIFYGDNRGVSIGPHNAMFSELALHLKNAKLTPNNNFINNFSKYTSFSKEKQNDITILSPEEFEMMVIPYENKPITNVLLTPKEYFEVLKEKENVFQNLKNLIKDSNLSEDQEKALHVAIQGYYREWLVSSGNIKNLTDIVKMIDINHTKEPNNIDL